MKMIKISLITLLFVFMYSAHVYSQTPDATADFAALDLQFTTTPEFPGICSTKQGIEVRVNEPFLSYFWLSPSGKSGGGLATAVLNEVGEWTIRVNYEYNGIICLSEKKLT